MTIDNTLGFMHGICLWRWWCYAWPHYHALKDPLDFLSAFAKRNNNLCKGWQKPKGSGAGTLSNYVYKIRFSGQDTNTNLWFISLVWWVELMILNIDLIIKCSFEAPMDWGDIRKKPLPKNFSGIFIRDVLWALFAGLNFSLFISKVVKGRILTWYFLKFNLLVILIFKI